jgi:hypothetical protein
VPTLLIFAATPERIARARAVVRIAHAAHADQIAAAVLLDGEVRPFEPCQRRIRPPAPRLLNVRVAVEEGRGACGFQLGQRGPARLIRALERWEERQPVQTVLPQILHDADDGQALRPDRAGVRGPQTIRAKLRRPTADQPAIRLVHSTQTRRLPVAKNARCLRLGQQVQRGCTADIAQAQVLARAAISGICQDAAQRAAAAVNIGKNGPNHAVRLQIPGSG